MKKSQAKQLGFKGEITVFLSLIVVLFISFIGSMVQSASIHINKSMKRADTKLALESVFAEYEREILDEYNVFVKLDPDETNISRRLWFYGAKNMEHEIQKIELITDSKGRAFYEQAVRSLDGDILTVSDVPNILWEEEAKEVNGQLESALEEGNQSLPTENNPLESVKRLQESNFLSMVIGEKKVLSNRYVILEELPSHRKLNQGTYNLSSEGSTGGTQKVLFMKYLENHFPNFVNDNQENSLFYESEYLLEGKESDQENLEAVLKKILLIRTGINYTYLLTDEVKKAEAEAMAAGLSSMVLLPELTPLVKQAILFAWAYGESIQDIRALSDGKRVPTVKTSDTWQLSLEGLTKLGTAEDNYESKETAEGMNYTDYMKLFLLAENTETLSMRALDLMELKMGIRMDGCVTALQVKSTCKMQRNIKDIFLTEYRYQ